ncbi:MAG: four helix bundle protein [Anaerolineales bacterium]
MTKQYGGFRELVAWQKARQLMLFVHQEVIPLLPAEERWDLTSQIRRSSKSVMANVAEGYGRYYYQETIRFCYIARGSLEETYSHLITALDLNYIPPLVYSRGEEIIQEVDRLLNGYIAYLKRTCRGGELPGGRLKEIEGDYLTDDGVPTISEPDPWFLIPTVQLMEL